MLTDKQTKAADYITSLAEVISGSREVHSEADKSASGSSSLSNLSSSSEVGLLHYLFFDTHYLLKKVINYNRNSFSVDLALCYSHFIVAISTTLFHFHISQRVIL